MAGGNWTNLSDSEVYSGVISIDSVRIALLIAELNDLKVMAADIGNAFLHGYTKKKIYTVAGPEFDKLQRRILVCVNHYEYIAVYSDGLLIFSKDLIKILEGLETLYPLKGVGRPEFYLGGDVNMVKMAKGHMHAFSARTHIKNVCEKMEKLYETSLRNYGSPLEGGVSSRIGQVRPLSG